MPVASMVHLYLKWFDENQNNIVIFRSLEKTSFLVHFGFIIYNLQ